MPQSKPAQTQYPIHPLLAERWSPMAFSSEPLSPEVIGSLLEAARWAPSSMNEQPWHYIYATIDHPEEHALLVSCLVEANQTWARHAPFLAVSIARDAFLRNGRANDWARHDVGQATMSMAIEAAHLGLHSHQMGGILPDRIREVFAIPAGHSPVAAIAIGHRGPQPGLPEAVLAREESPRARRPLEETFLRASDAAGQAIR